LTPIEVVRKSVEFVKRVATAWSDDQCGRKAAALAYYTAFSLAPILVIVLWLVGFVVDAAVATEELRSQLIGLAGPTAADAIDAILKHTQREARSLTAIAIALPVLLIGATTAFSELKESLDEIWGVQPESQKGIWGLLRTRLMSFGMILVIAFLLLVSLLVNAFVVLASRQLAQWIGLSGAVALQILSTALAILIVAVIFAAIYKLLPAIRLRWRDVGRASLVTTLLFMAGQIAIGMYLGNSATASAFGAAGSLAVLMLWIYYSSAVFLLGAELNKFWLHPAKLSAQSPAGAESVARSARPRSA
jgi:membrane protein